MSTSISCIGAGRVIRILLQGMTKKDNLPDRIIVVDTNADILRNLKQSFPMIETKTAIDESVTTANFIVIALHPPAVVDMIKSITPIIGQESILVSLAPKIKTTMINQITGGKNPVIRMIPNAPSLVNEGYNPVFFGPGCSDQVRKTFTDLMAPLGTMPEVAEETLEAYAVITAMGPTYLWFQLVELIRLGESFGLSTDEANRAVLSMTAGAVKTMQESDLTPAGVMDLVPVKPMADHEETIKGMYTRSLTGLYGKLTSQ
ncbi:MAG TPA: NAD(P)-binding domain-containing protein [Methanospirillum sp.]|nr:NAD(P)-binding domain-containing protein [Methanospirillum sp.]